MIIVTGNLLAHDAACTVTSWNMSVFPHWFLIPALVSRQLIDAGTAGLTAEKSLQPLIAAADPLGSECELSVVLWDGSKCP